VVKSVQMQSFRRRRTGGGRPDGAGATGPTSPSPRKKYSIPRTVRVSSHNDDSVSVGVQSLAEAESDASMRGSRTISSSKNKDALSHYQSFTGEELLVRTAATNTDTGAEEAARQADDGGHTSSKSRTSRNTSAPREAMAKEAVAKDESRSRKVLVRAISGLLMVSGFGIVLYSGHVYICAIIASVEMLLFRELVKVRYNTFFHIIEDTIPMFRTTQWLWFCVAIFYTYSDFVVEVIKSNTALHHLLIYAQLQTPLAFCLYSGTFVLTIATLQAGHIKFQLNQLCWTIVVLCLTVGQLKYVMHNVYNGLFWFALPIMLVVTNDVWAYICGMLCGRKFIHRPFIALSPNKTWEGFIGGGIFTVIIGWYFARIMAQFTWLTCPTNQFSLFPEKLECDLDPIFHEASSIINPQVFEIIPTALVKLLPGVVDICAVDGDSNTLTPCISGEETHSHHHFELVIKNVYPVQIHALSLSMFASLVAPFGGFLASAIKRAYGIKDFDSIIPGRK